MPPPRAGLRQAAVERLRADNQRLGKRRSHWGRCHRQKRYTLSAAWCKFCITFCRCTRFPDPHCRIPMPLPAPDPHVRRWIRRELASGAAPRVVAHHHRLGRRHRPAWRRGDAGGPHRVARARSASTSDWSARACSGLRARAGSRRSPSAGESLYRLTRDGARRFEQAYRRIYAAPVEGWDESWEIVIADGPTAGEAPGAQAGARVGGLRHARARASTRALRTALGRSAHRRGARPRRRDRRRPRIRRRRARRPDARLARAGGLGSRRRSSSRLPRFLAPLRQGHPSLPQAGKATSIPRSRSSCARC